jgi:hypothetical protein
LLIPATILHIRNGTNDDSEWRKACVRKQKVSFKPCSLILVGILFNIEE